MTAIFNPEQAGGKDAAYQKGALAHRTGENATECGEEKRLGKAPDAYRSATSR